MLKDDSLVEEYFDRRKRRHSLWKSEAEYNAYIENELAGKPLEKVKEAITIMLNSLEGKKIYVIDDAYFEYSDKEIQKLESVRDKLDETSYNAQKEGKMVIKGICDGLKKYAADNEIKPDYVFLKSTQFSSGFGKPDFSQIKIVFNKDEHINIKNFQEVVPTLKFSAIDKDYYFIYSKNLASNLAEDKNIYTYLMKSIL